MPNNLIQVKCISAIRPYTYLSDKINTWLIQNVNKYKIIDIKFVTLSTAYIIYIDTTEKQDCINLGEVE